MATATSTLSTSKAANTSRIVEQNACEPLPRIWTAALVALCTAKLLLHVFTSVRHYGYFRDELYYLDMARHLDWGYVDAAPLIALYAKVALLLGGSLEALRMIPALAGTALLATTMFLARELGANRYGQFLAGLAILLCPSVLVADSLLTMNAVEPLIWMGSLLVVARILRTSDSRLWLWFGVLCGIGLENKHSTLSFGFAVTVALLLTQQRREFARSWIWIGGAIALALFLPNIVWQINHHFPTIEDLANVRREAKNVVLPPLAFVKEQIMDMHPILLPVWLTGVIWLIRERRWRVLGLTFLVFFVLMEVAHAKNYYVFPIYPVAFAAGAVAIGRWLANRPAWTRVAVVVVMVREVASIYNSLPPEERAKTGVWAGNYGEAGAVNLFGPQYGLPTAYSRHQNHWYWGPPPQVYENLIVIQWSEDDVRDDCTSYQAFEHYNRFGMDEENGQIIFLCRGVKFDIQKIWSNSHHWN